MPTPGFAVLAGLTDLEWFELNDQAVMAGDGFGVYGSRTRLTFPRQAGRQDSVGCQLCTIRIIGEHG